ncbi:peptidylprolyl isomerase [Butyrivibrio sp. CB08]|uniref:peptidylprolyl isomerase n=1 Tax=Butyrivibrio sp. CB08 TaxID=2364879 RepID=UPI000EA86781|nr:peptidylprolyl isomerase [Butyrivibrio sp. CB08]RKM61383.1 peptidylprolyl isomerase [Butyrivibrio sp. CB08]
MRRHFSVIAVMTALILTLSGCAPKELLDRRIVFTTGFDDGVVFRIEDVSCSLQEAMVYLVNTQKGYEDTFGSDIWGKETDAGTVEDRLKESVLAKLAQIKVMNLLAAENGIELSKEELSLAKQASEAYYESLSQSDIDAMAGVTQEEITSIMEQQAIANKLYDYIIRDINPEISDDEARTITVEQILIKTYSVDESGEKIPFTEREKNAAYNRIRDILKKIWADESFEELMAEYNEADEGTISFGKGGMESVYETAAFNLGTEEISEIVETSEGYVLIKCISTFNREETEANKVKIVDKRKREVFGAQYDAFVATLTKQLNTKLWDSITLNEDEQVSSANLMDVYNEYFD